MKLVRPILIFVGVILLLCVLAVGLALIPALQRRAILRAAGKYPELQLKLDSVSAGFSSLTLRGVQVEHRGVKVSLEQLHADYSLWAFLMDRQIQIEQLTAQGLLVDASQLSAQKTQAGLAAAPAATSGALAQVKLPWALTLGKTSIQGRVLLAGSSGQPALQGEFQLTGGQISPGHEGELRLLTRVNDPTPGARVTTLDALATLQLRESLERNFDHIAITSVLNASGPGLSGQNQLKLRAEMSRMAAGENYQVTLDTLRAGKSEQALKLNATPTAGNQAYVGEWTLALSSAQLESFFLGYLLPKFSANGSGQFTVSTATTRASMQGNLQVEASEFEKLQPKLRAVGAVQLQSSFDLVAEKGLIQVKQLALGLASGAQPVLELRTSGTPQFNRKSRQLETADALPGEILRLKLSGLPVAWLAPFCTAAEISGGHVTGEISVVQGKGRQITLQTTAPLATDGIAVARAGRTLLAKASLLIEAEAELSPAQMGAKIRAFTLKTPEGDIVHARMTVSVPSGLPHAVAMSGDFTAELPTLLLPLLPAGALKAKGDVDLTWQGDHLEVRRLASESTDSKGSLLGSITVIHPFTYDLAHGQVATDDPNEISLANIKLGQWPLLTVAQIFADYSVSGRLAPAEWVVSAQAGKLSVRATAPVSILDFSLTQKKAPVLDRLKLQLQPIVEFNAGAVTRVQSGAVTLQTGSDVSLAQLKTELTQGEAGLRTTTTFSLDLPAWSSQPMLAGQDALSAGQASGEVRAAFAGGSAQIEARATLNGMVASESGQTLPVANLSLRADVDASGHFSLKSPLLLDHAGHRSDLLFVAEGAVAAKGLSFDAKLTAAHLELPDMLLLLAVAGSPLGGEGAESTAAQGRALSPPAADQTAFWIGTRGQISLDCQSIVSGKDWMMSGLTGRLSVSDDRVQLEKLAASFDEKSQFTAEGALVFEPGLDPYHLTGEFSLTEFDTGRFFKAINPESTPTLEGLFTVKGQLEGQGLNFDDTFDRTRGTFDLTSRKGVFRGLKRLTDKTSIVTKAVDLVGSIIGDKTAEKIATTSYFIDQLAQEYGELKFDQFAVHAVREPSLNLRLENISLVSPQIRLLGSGLVTYAPATPLLKQPLQATFSLRARGKTEELLAKIKDLEGTRDELGYAKTKTEIIVGGTLLKPDAEAYFIRLGVSKLSDKLSEFLAPAN